MKTGIRVVATSVMAAGLVMLAQQGVTALGQESKPAAALGAAGVPAPALRVATCDVYKIAERLMKTAKFVDPIKAAGTEAQDKLAPQAKELEALRNRIQAAGGPEADKAGMAEFQQKQQAFANAQQVAERSFDRFTAQTNHAAFQEVAQAAQRVAKAKGYTHVFSTRPLDVGGGPDTPLQFTLGVLARPVVVAPPEDDLTEAVMAECKLD